MIKINQIKKIFIILSLTLLTGCATTYSHKSGNNSNLSIDSRMCDNQADIQAPVYLCRNPFFCQPDETALVFNSIERNSSIYDQCMLSRGYQPQ
tara:strand:- start:103 stop:384 length:282 start_codon:yes stop_codon:yes gene_type:complete